MQSLSSSHVTSKDDQGIAKPLVILFFAESFSSPEVAWSLSNSGLRVIAVARRDSRAAIRVSRYAAVVDITPPESDASASIDELRCEINRQLGSTDAKIALLPLDDAAVWICSQLATQERLTIVGPANFDIALDKQAQLSLAREAGFNVPETLAVRGGDSVFQPTFGFPLILKPMLAISQRNGKLTKGRFHICQNASQLGAAIRNTAVGEPMLAQQYVFGIGEGLFGLALNDRVLAWSAHRRIRMMNPLGSGASACVSISADLAHISAGTRFIERCTWRGPFMIELLKDESGKNWFMEFNGRLWGSTSLARRCGLEYPAWAVWEALEQRKTFPEKIQTPLGVVCRHAGRETMHGLFVLRGPRTNRSSRWPSRWKTVLQLLRIRRSEYWYNWRADDWRVFIKDFFVTIEDNLFKQSQKQP